MKMREELLALIEKSDYKGMNAVSYTHLDVYKRQEKDNIQQIAVKTKPLASLFYCVSKKRWSILMLLKKR